MLSLAIVGLSVLTALGPSPWYADALWKGSDVVLHLACSPRGTSCRPSLA